ncbi:hypothetical protein PVAP13_2KG047516 [Panicum virgatum]|uniref:Uncharacterized protein n=1 Tax=Panicum virgatum TaxID=38727 RepID=A0A8T0VSI3_PANVG|nr:hypothetical protein PVAP13_2KG047516 [Panicum virgatum]
MPKLAATLVADDHLASATRRAGAPILLVIHATPIVISSRERLYIDLTSSRRHPPRSSSTSSPPPSSLPPERLCISAMRSSSSAPSTHDRLRATATTNGPAARLPEATEVSTAPLRSSSAPTNARAASSPGAPADGTPPADG